MNTGCSFYRDQIPQSLLGELAQEAQKALEQHLAECQPCSQERDLYASTFRQLRADSDVPVPRHFFVLPEQRRPSPWELFRQMSAAWQVSLAAAALVLGVSALMAAARLQVRAENGALTLGFGRLPAPVVATPTPPQAVDTSALQDDIIRVLEERNRKENLEWVRTLRAEIARSNRILTVQQRSALDTALGALESRMDDRLVAATRTLRDDTDRSISQLYQAVTLERQGDNAALNARISRVAANSNLKNSETDAVLETLLQVAEFRTRQ